MIIRIIEKAKGLLRLEVDGEGHTLCNLLQTILLENPSVEIAGYDKQHPLTETAILYVRTKGTDSAENLLAQAANKGRQMAEDFLRESEKELGWK